MSLFSVVLFSLTSCASLNMGKMVVDGSALALDESKRAQETQQLLQNNGVFIEIKGFGDIVRELQEVLYPDDEPVSVQVVRMPGENAFALSNGLVVIHLGLLATLENVEQLAFVLAHEIAHIKLNHGYLGASHRRRQRISAHMSDIVTFGLTDSHRRYVNNIKSYTRATEYAADRFAAKSLQEANFSLTPAVGFFRTLNNYPSFDELVDKEATHPSNNSRINRLQGLLKHRQEGVERKAALDASFQRIRPYVLGASVAEKIEDIDFIAAIIQLAELTAISGETETSNCAGGDIYYAMALLKPGYYSHLIEVYLASSDTVDGTVVYEPENAKSSMLNSAANYYRRALVHSKQSDCGLRGLGLVNYTLNDYAKADLYLQDYIYYNSSADDLPFIQSILDSSSSSEF